MRVKNISGYPQHFVGIGTFKVDEVREVEELIGYNLLRSPHISLAGSVKGIEQESKSLQRRKNSLRGIEQD